jgi:hypothetical protein
MVPGTRNDHFFRADFLEAFFGAAFLPAFFAVTRCPRLLVVIGIASGCGGGFLGAKTNLIRFESSPMLGTGTAYCKLMDRAVSPEIKLVQYRNIQTGSQYDTLPECKETD